jgi:hypothetical protein
LWHGRPTRITDLSRGGCHIESRFPPAPGTVAEVTVLLRGRPIILRGTVMHSQHRLGFAMRFDVLDEPTQDFLIASLDEVGVTSQLPAKARAKTS